MPQPFFRLLDETGDGTGNTNANGDYSSAAVDFKLAVPAAFETKVEVHRMIVHIEDVGPPLPAVYGNLPGALTNGITFLVLDANGNTLRDMCDNVRIKTNADYGKFCYDVTFLTGTGNDFVQVRWTFAEAGVPIIIQKGWSLVARCNDDLTGLVAHTFNIQGVYR